MYFKLNTSISYEHFDLSFVTDNIYDPTYRVVEEDGNYSYAISFYADSEKNGQMTVHLHSKKDETNNEAHFKSRTIYTANSSTNTFISFASMETVMELAGQEINTDDIFIESRKTSKSSAPVQ